MNADEDHISLQDGSTTIVPLISIHEGIERQGRRGRCIHPHYISSHGRPLEELWLEAARWIDQSYNVDDLERVYLHGDGASWIKEGLNWLPNAKMVLDRYQLNKAVTTVTARQREKRFELYSALAQGNRAAFRTVAVQLMQEAKDDAERNRVQKFSRYIANNWAGIAIHSHENCGGNCTEGHVSHVLSSRLSSRPMGWSREGLRVMAELRAYTKSGGRIKLEHLKGASSTYTPTKTALRKAKKVFAQTTREQFGNVAILARGKVLPLFGWLRGLQNGSPTL